MGGVNAEAAPRVTELALLAEGVRFEIRGAEVRCFGPRERADLAELMRAEVTRRTEAFAAHLARLMPGAFVSPPVVSRAHDACDACGDTMPRLRGNGMCALCLAAWRKVLDGRAAGAGRAVPMREAC